MEKALSYSVILAQDIKPALQKVHAKKLERVTAVGEKNGKNRSGLSFIGGLLLAAGALILLPRLLDYLADLLPSGGGHSTMRSLIGALK